MDSLRTPLEAFYQREATQGSDTCFVQPNPDGSIVEFSWQQVGDQVRRMAAYLRSLNYEPGSNIALMSNNCAHWIMADVVIWMAGHTSVPLYPVLTAKSIWNGRQERDTTYLNFWLSQGYAIVASDYQGLGTSGAHPYLATRPSSYSTLDIVRAVQNSDFPVSGSIVLFGQSQGAGAAFASAGYAREYAPELDIRAVVVTGIPYFTAEGLAAVQAVRPKDVVDPKLGYNFLSLSMLDMIDPEFVLEDYVAKDVLPVAKAVANTCYAELKPLIKREALTYDRAFKRSPGEALKTAFKRMEYPTLALNIPAFVGIGGKDADTPPHMQQGLVRDACASGTAITVRFYPEGTHGSIVLRSTTDSSKFVRAAFDGAQLVGNCEQLPF